MPRSGGSGSIAAKKLRDGSGTIHPITGNLTDGEFLKLDGTDVISGVGNRYDAIVDSSGNGDYTSIFSAFNDGNQRVLVIPGTYTETSTIQIPDGGHLIGATIDGVNVTLSGSVRIESDAGSAVESAGTISITNSTSSVTGSGTSFTNLS